MSVWVSIEVGLYRNYLIKRCSVGNRYIVKSVCLMKTFAVVCFPLMGQICHRGGDWADPKLVLICMFPLFPLHQHRWSRGHGGSIWENGKLIWHVTGSYIWCLHQVRRENHVALNSSEDRTCPFGCNVLNVIMKW